MYEAEPGSQAKMGGMSAEDAAAQTAEQAFEAADATLLLIPTTLAESAAARLRMFVLRAEVEVELSDQAIAGLEIGNSVTEYAGLELAAGDGAAAQGQGLTLGRVIGDAERAYLIADPGTSPAATPDYSREDWELADVRAGLPIIGPATAEHFVPQMVNLDLLGGISFTKGCYVGQEVVARTQNLGRIKRRMFRFATPAPAEPGNSVVDQAGTTAGEVVRCAAAEEGHELLAVVQLAALAGPLFVGDARLAALPLPYSIPDQA